MEYAQEDNNLVGGQVGDSVGQDGEQSQTENSDGWEQQAKYFQSEKDKLYDENQKLQKLAKIGEFIQDRPDVAEKLAGYIRGDEPQQNNKPVVEREEFDSWEAYNDPSSKSYQLRQSQQNSEISNAVQNAVGSAMKGINEENATNNLRTALKERGLNDGDVKEFFNFASKNPSEYGIDGAIRMWRAAEGKNMTNENPLDAIRNTQSNPQTGGIIQGARPAKADASEELWKSIIGAQGPMGADGKLP